LKKSGTTADLENVHRRNVVKPPGEKKWSNPLCRDDVRSRILGRTKFTIKPGREKIREGSQPHC